MTPPGTQSHAAPSIEAPGSGTPTDSSLDSQIDALLSDAAVAGIAENGADADAPPKSAAADAEAAVASIERQVESLVDQFVEQGSPQDVSATVTPNNAGEPTLSPISASTAELTAFTNPEPATSATPESIGALDDQLARLTDELLTAPATETFQAPSVKFAPTPEDQIAPPPAEAVPQAAVAPSPIVPAPAPTEALKSAILNIPAAPNRHNKLVHVLAKPLAGRPRLIRDTAGWLGFNSMFLAGVVWSYHLWFQRPEKPVAQHAPAALVSSDGHGESAHGEAPMEGHGAAAGADTHSSAEHGSEAGAQHANAAKEADEPITGVNPLHKKKPTYALSDAMAEKLNIAKKADAGHGGGGHGAEKKSGSGHGAPPKSGH